MAQEHFSSSPAAPANKSASMPSSSDKHAEISTLRARQASLESMISQLIYQRDSLVGNLTAHSSSPEAPDEDARVKIAMENADQKIKAQIKQLQRYNDIKDIGTQLMGMIAEKRDCRIAEIQEEFGIKADD